MIGGIQNLKTCHQTGNAIEDENGSEANEQSLKFNMDDVRAMQMQVDCLPLN
jgi:hypothetical protein